MKTVLNVRTVFIFVAHIYRTMNPAVTDNCHSIFLLFQLYFIKQIAFPIIGRYLTLRR